VTTCPGPSGFNTRPASRRAFLKQSPLNEFCRALFNLNEFVYVE
jgi:hypothetical protein